MRSLLPLLALFVLIFSVPAHSATMDNFVVAGWEGGAYSNDKTGQFSHCAISTPYQSGITLVFTIDSKLNWSMAFYNNVWQLNQGASYQLSYSVDNDAAIQATGLAFDPHGVSVDLPDSGPLFEQFRYGNQLRLEAAGGTFFFNLIGTSKALSAILACSNKWASARNGSQASDPFSIPPSQQSVSTHKSDPAEAVAFVSNLLSVGGVTGFAIATPQDAAKILPGYDAVWTVQGTIGGVIVAPDEPGRDVDKVFMNLSSEDAKACKGKFASLRQPIEDQSRNYLLGRMVTACEENASNYEVYYTLFARSKGGTYLMAVIGTKSSSGDSDAQKADTNILNAVYREMKGNSNSQ